MTALATLLAELFTSQGWKATQGAALEGRSGTVYGAPVLAESDDFVLLVERRGPDEPVPASLVEEMARVVEDTGADAGLLAHLGPIEQEAVRAAAGRIYLWDQDTLVSLIGQTRLAIAADTEFPDLPLEHTMPSTVESLLPPAFNDGPDLAALETLGSAELFAPAEPTPLEAPETPAIMPDIFPAAPATETSYPALPARITVEEAAAATRDRLFSVADGADLVLQPIHLLDYECDLLLEGSLRYDTVEGRVEVHGTSKDVREVDPMWLDPVKVAPVVYDRVDERVLRITHERAIELAHAALIKTHSRIVEIETQDEDEDFIVMERKDVAPRPDQVRVQHIGTVLRPFWRLRGGNGAVLVDAITGEVVGEELRTPDPDALVID